MIAELTFGFWRYLVASQYDRTLWKPVFLGAFGGQARRKPVYGRLARLHNLRNRIAHHEPIHAEPLQQCYDELLTLSEWINLDYRRWIEKQSSVTGRLAARPF